MDKGKFYSGLFVMIGLVVIGFHITGAVEKYRSYDRTVNVKGLGKVKTIKFAAKLVAGEIFTGETDMLIWVSDDDNRVPVCFEAPIRVGAGAGRLKEWSGLKHPFTALIEPVPVKKK